MCSADRVILVPLTNSLYVPGKLCEVDNVLIDVGTGYYVKKVRQSIPIIQPWPLRVRSLVQCVFAHHRAGQMQRDITKIRSTTCARTSRPYKKLCSENRTTYRWWVRSCSQRSSKPVRLVRRERRRAEMCRLGRYRLLCACVYVWLECTI